MKVTNRPERHDGTQVIHVHLVRLHAVRPLDVGPRTQTQHTRFCRRKRFHYRFAITSRDNVNDFVQWLARRPVSVVDRLTRFSNTLVVRLHVTYESSGNFRTAECRPVDAV